MVFSESPFCRDSREFGDVLEILESPQTPENEGESDDHLLEIPETIEFLEILEPSPLSSEKTPFAMTPFFQ